MRITQCKNEKNCIPDQFLEPSESAYIGIAADRLSSFENVFDELTHRQKETISELEKLKMQDKSKTLRFRELMASKFTNAILLSLFASNGIKE